MTNKFTAKNYAAQIGNTTIITRAFLKENAVKFIQSKKGGEDITDKDVYVYEGITGASPIDEVYTESVRDQDEKGNAYWREDHKVRLTDMYAHLK